MTLIETKQVSIPENTRVKAGRQLHLPRSIQYLLTTAGIAGVALGVSACGEQIPALITPLSITPFGETATPFPAEKLFTATPIVEPTGIPTRASTATEGATQTPPKTDTPEATNTLDPTATKVKTNTPAAPTVTTDPAEVQRQMLSQEFTTLNNTAGWLPDNNKNHETINFAGYKTTKYISSDGYPIMVATGGTNGLQSTELAQQVADWIDWSIQNSPTINSIIDKAKVRFYVFDSPILSALNHASDPQNYGSYWGVEMVSKLLLKPDSYGTRGGGKPSAKGWFLAYWEHELVRLFNQNTHPRNQFGFTFDTSPLQDTINKELITASAGDQATLNVLQ